MPAVYWSVEMLLSLMLYYDGLLLFPSVQSDSDYQWE